MCEMDKLAAGLNDLPENFSISLPMFPPTFEDVGMPIEEKI